MSTANRRVRRLLAISLPIVALLLLAWLGRYATSSAAPPVAAASSSALSSGAISSPVVTDASPAALGGGGAVGADSGSASVDGGDSRPRPLALEVLPDGGIVVDLNTANEDDLRHLPGVGAMRAKAIVDLRARLGRLKGVEDLARIKGFGRATLKRLRPMTRASAN